jgi:DNA adenine methylase
MCAYKMLFFNKCNFSGIETSGPIGGSKQESKYKIDCRYNASKIKQGIKEINQVTRGRVVTSNVDINNCFLLWNSDYPAYLDPPYFCKGSELYVNYMEETEHEQMAKRLSSRSNWLLSYDDCSEIRDLYQEKEVVDLSVRYSINGKKEAWSNKKELLIKS